MLAILQSFGMFFADLFKSRRRLEAKNLFLRHQLSIALRRAPPRLRQRNADRALLVWMTRLWPSLLGAANRSTGDYCVYRKLRLACSGDAVCRRAPVT